MWSVECWVGGWVVDERCYEREDPTVVAMGAAARKTTGTCVLGADKCARCLTQGWSTNRFKILIFISPERFRYMSRPLLVSTLARYCVPTGSCSFMSCLDSPLHTQSTLFTS